MEQHITNYPSSNTWVKFEDSDTVIESQMSYSCSPSSSDVRIENVNKLAFPAMIPQSVNIKTPMKDRKSYPNNNHSRYSAFDCLRFGVNKNNLGWSSYLLGEEANETARSRNYQG